MDMHVDNGSFNDLGQSARIIVNGNMSACEFNKLKKLAAVGFKDSIVREQSWGTKDGTGFPVPSFTSVIALTS